MHTAICYFAALALVLPLAGCVTHRTVTSGGRTVSQGPVIKRPIHSLVQRSRQ
jgi:outer membrane protein assembly factor BamE (lipoprotein component of BamABCDE complex)